MENCIFCKIIEGQIPCTKVYEDEKILSFFSITPHNQGHTLVIPKKHYRNLIDMDEETVIALALAVQKITRAVYKGVKAEGINVITNNEAPSGQVIFHAHTHIIPRFANDGLEPWDKNTPYQEGEEEKMAEMIKKEI